MSAPTTVTQLLEIIEKSEILDRKMLLEQVEQFRGESEPKTPADMAEALCRTGAITRFQAQQFLLGKWRNFIISGKYVLLNMLGAGGMANVFLCEHRIMRRKVALKVLPHQLAADSSSVERFHREARAVARLDHPNIVRAHDVDKEGKLHFLVMEYVDGCNLHHLITRHGRLEVPRACSFIYQAALGLNHAHQAGIVHRDIKPGNLLVDRQDVVKILDMGLARLFGDQTEHLTREHDNDAVLGTADFLAPEQAVSSHDVDARADIYSLGLTFWFLLAGKGPFDGGTVAQKLIWQQVRQPAPLREIRPDVPAEVEAVLSRMIAKEPEARYQTAAEVAQALLPFVPVPSGVTESGTLRLPEGTKPAPGSGPARPGSAPASPARLPSVSASTPLPARDLEVAPQPPRDKPSSRGERGSGRKKPPAPPALEELPPTEDIQAIVSAPTARSKSAPGSSPSARRAQQAPSSRQQRITAGEPATSAGPRALAELPLQTEGEIRRGVPWLVLAASVLVAIAATVVGIVLILPSLGPDKPVVQNPIPNKVVPPDKGPKQTEPAPKPPDVTAPPPVSKKVLLEHPLRPYLLEGHRQPITRALLIRQGHHVLSASAEGDVYLWQFKTQDKTWSAVRELQGIACPILDLAVSPDGKLAAACGQDRVVRIWQIDTGSLIHTLPHAQPVHALAFTLDNRGLLCGRVGGVQMYALPGAKDAGHYLGHQDAVTCLVPLPNGQLIASGGSDQSLRLWDLASTEEIWSVDAAHAGGVTSVDVSPSGRWLVTGGKDNLLHLWDAETGTRVRTFTGHTGAITRVAFVKDGDRILSGSVDRTVRIWEAVSGKQVAELVGHADTVTSVSTVAAGRSFLSASADRAICLWNYPSFPAFQGELRAFSGHTGPVETVAVSPCNRRLASGSHDKTIRLWDIASGTCVSEFKGHKGHVLSVAFSPDGKFLLSGSADKTVRLWTLASGKSRELKGTTGSVYSVSFSPDGQFALAGSYDKTFRSWRVATGEDMGDRKDVHSVHVWSATYSPNGRTIATTGNDKVARLWDPWTGEKLRDLVGHEKEVRRLAFAPDGKRILTGSFDGTLRLWHTETGKLIKKFDAGGRYVEGVAFSPDGRCAASSEGQEIKGKGAVGDRKGIRIWDLTGKTSLLHRWADVPGKIFQVAFTADGRHVVAGCEDKLVRIWRIPPASWLVNAGEIRVLTGHAKEVDAVALSSDGKQILSASRDGALRLWPWTTSKLQPPRELAGKGGEPASAVALAPDGKTALTGGKDKLARLWDILGDKELQLFQGHKERIRGVLFTPNGEQVLTCSDDRTARLWNLKGQMLREFAAHRQSVTGMALSADGRQLLTASLDKTVHVWDVDSNKVLRTYNRHTVGVHALALSPDGRLALSGAADGLAHLWDVETAKTLHVLEGHVGAVTAVGFTPDGKRLLTGGADSTLRVWDARLGQAQTVFGNAGGAVTGLAVIQDGRQVLVSSASWQLRVFGLSPVE